VQKHDLTSTQLFNFRQIEIETKKPDSFSKNEGILKTPPPGAQKKLYFFVSWCLQTHVWQLQTQSQGKEAHALHRTRHKHAHQASDAWPAPNAPFSPAPSPSKHERLAHDECSEEVLCL